MAKTGKQGKKAELSPKERILEHAIDAFSKWGFHGTTTRAIARESDSNISALHYYWGDKRELYEAAVIEVNKKIGRSHKEIGEEIRDCLPEEKIAIAVEVMSRMLFSNPECAALYIMDANFRNEDGDGRVGEGVKESAMRNYLAIFREFFGEEKPSQLDMIALIAMIHMVNHLVASRSYFMQVLDMDKEEDYVGLVNAVMRKLYRVILIKQSEPATVGPEWQTEK